MTDICARCEHERAEHDDRHGCKREGVNRLGPWQCDCSGVVDPADVFSVEVEWL